MQTRLLAFLAETERSIRAERPEPRTGAAWENSRAVNYRLGLARLTLVARLASAELSPLGAVLLQSFKLADGNVCLKANLTWQEGGIEISHSIYAKPEVEWEAEAGRVAAFWVAGPAIKDSPVQEPPELLAAG